MKAPHLHARSVVPIIRHSTGVHWSVIQIHAAMRRIRVATARNPAMVSQPVPAACPTVVKRADGCGRGHGERSGAGADAAAAEATGCSALVAAFPPGAPWCRKGFPVPSGVGASASEDPWRPRAAKEFRTI